MKTKKLISALLSAVLSVGVFSGCAVKNPAEESDKQGGAELSIAVTSPAIAQILDSLDYDNVIGIPETEREIPARYQSAVVIGAPMNPDLEIIKSLSPDIVLSPKTLESSLAVQYQNAGISSAFLDLASVEGMYGAISSLGTLLHKEEKARSLVDDYEKFLADYGDGKADGPSVLLLMCFPDGFFLASTEDSYVGNLVKLAGGRNVYADYESDNEGFLNINPEDMVQKEPDMILVFAHYNEDAAFAYMKKEFADNAAWSYFSAVQAGRIAYLPSDIFSMSATLSWTDALNYLEPILYNE